MRIRESFYSISRVFWILFCNFLFVKRIDYIYPQKIAFSNGAVIVANSYNIWFSYEFFNKVNEAQERGEWAGRDRLSFRPIIHGNPSKTGQIKDHTTNIHIDPTNADDLTKAALEGRKQVRVLAEFYKKYIDVNGMPVAAAAEVADLALQRTYDIVTHMLAGRPDVLEALVDRGMYLVIIGKDQVYTDLPENRNARNPDYLNVRGRGTGGHPTSFGEENLLSLPVDRYDDESIAVHEFAHTIDGALRGVASPCCW